MCRKFFNYAMIAVALAIFCFACDASAETVLFSDNFDGISTTPVDGNDYNLNTNLDNQHNRFGGTLKQSMIDAGKAWDFNALAVSLGQQEKVQVNNAARGTDSMLLYSNGSRVDTMSTGVIIQHNFIDQSIKDTGGFTVQFDTDPYSYPLQIPRSTPGNLGALYFFLGANTADQSDAARASIADSHTDIVMRINDNGRINLMWTDDSAQHDFSGGVAGQTTSGYYHYYQNRALDIIFDQSRSDEGTYGSVEQQYQFDVNVTLATSGSLTNFDDGALACLELYVRKWDSGLNDWGEQIAVDMNGDLAGTAFRFHWDADGNNYMGFGVFATQTTMETPLDNLIVTVVPEPSTLAMLGMGLLGLLAYAWRKHKQ